MSGFFDGVADGMADSAARRDAARASSAIYAAQDAERDARAARDETSNVHRDLSQRLSNVKQERDSLGASASAMLGAVRGIYQSMNEKDQAQFRARFEVELQKFIPEVQADFNNQIDVPAAIKANHPITVKALDIRL